MSVAAKDILWHASANMPENDSGTAGGAEDATCKVSFKDINSAKAKVCSSSGSDTTQTVTLTFRVASGEPTTEVVTLTGQTLAPVSGTTNTLDRLLKAVKSATCAGDIAVISATPTLSGTAVAVGADYIDLPAGGSATNEAYTGYVIRITGGSAGVGQVREIPKYVGGSTKRVYVRDWAVLPTGTVTFDICEGAVMDKITSPAIEHMSIVRPLIGPAAEDPTGSARTYYAKIFARNINTTKALLNAQIAENSSAGIEAGGDRGSFALAGTLGDSGTSTNRRTDPGGLTFNSTAKNVANSGTLSANTAQGVWVKLNLTAGLAALNSYYELATSGDST